MLRGTGVLLLGAELNGRTGKWKARERRRLRCCASTASPRHTSAAEVRGYVRGQQWSGPQQPVLEQTLGLLGDACCAGSQVTGRGQQLRPRTRTWTLGTFASRTKRCHVCPCSSAENSELGAERRTARRHWLARATSSLVSRPGIGNRSQIELWPILPYTGRRSCPSKPFKRRSDPASWAERRSHHAQQMTARPRPP